VGCPNISPAAKRRLPAAALRRLAMAAGRLGFAGLLGASAHAVADEFSGNLAWTTDYRFRGESLSDRRPAVQGGIDFGHTSGLFAGAFASSVRTNSPDTHLIAQLYAGYARRFDDGLVAEAGAVHYVYWHDPRPVSADYTEGFAGIGGERWNVRLYGTSDYLGSGAAAAYLEGSMSRELWPRVHASVHLGGLATGPADYAYSEYSSARRLDARAGVADDFSWVQVELSAVGVAARHGDCANGTHRCSPGVILTARHGF
jgi:uncharacterized protein (TIGR02001 family)